VKTALERRYFCVQPNPRIEHHYRRHRAYLGDATGRIAPERSLGCDDRDIVPLTILVATQELGAILIGAFDGSLLIGFAYGRNDQAVGVYLLSPGKRVQDFV
jgi:hypothetical protein